MSAKHQVDELRAARGANHTRVGHHTLEWEGAPHDKRGHRLFGEGRGAVGYGKCFCGVLSPDELPSAAARKRWHRQHKLDILAGGAA
jgi:hypothetical protein